MDKEIALLQRRIDKLELDNCEAQNEIDKLQKAANELKDDHHDVLTKVWEVKDLLRKY